VNTYLTKSTHFYSFHYEEKDSFGPNWEPLDNDTVITESFDEAFRYTSRESLNGSVYWGYLGVYGGGGFVFNLGDDPDVAEADLNLLEQSQWLDQYTRAIFVEFSVWNANTNLMSSFTTCLEFPPSRGLFTWTTIEVVNLYRYSGPAGVVNLLAEIIVVIYMVVLTVLTIKDVINLKKNFFNSFWNGVVVLSLVIFYIAVVCYVMRTLWTITCIENMMNNPGKSAMTNHR
jgi:polycystin 1L2